MTRVKLIRVEKDHNLTRGVLLVDGKYQAVTLELPYRDNQRDISCIPVGTYNCQRVQSPRFGNTFEVTEVPGRSHILFHAGNYPRDTRGCILLGTSMYADLASISQSRSAMGGFLVAMQNIDEFELEIQEVF
jgi:hypothetical protein